MEFTASPAGSEKTIPTTNPGADVVLGVVNLNIAPWGRVYLNGTLLHEYVEGPIALDVVAASHTLSVVHPVYGQWERHIDLSQTHHIDLDVDFREHITLNVTAFDEADRFIQGEIFVDGETTNYFTPMSIDVAVGERVIEVRADGYVAARDTVTILSENGRTATLKLILQSR